MQSWEKIQTHSGDPWYDICEDWDLIVSSFQSQYGIRLTRELKGMKWSEFSALLVGISPDTALGRIVSIRSETDKEVLKRMTPSQRKIRSDWAMRRVKHIQTPDKLKERDEFLAAFLSALKQRNGMQKTE